VLTLLEPAPCVVFAGAVLDAGDVTAGVSECALLPPPHPATTTTIASVGRNARTPE